MGYYPVKDIANENQINKCETPHLKYNNFKMINVFECVLLVHIQLSTDWTIILEIKITLL